MTFSNTQGWERVDEHTWATDEEIFRKKSRGRPYDGAIINEDGELVIPRNKRTKP